MPKIAWKICFYEWCQICGSGYNISGGACCCVNFWKRFNLVICFWEKRFIFSSLYFCTSCVAFSLVYSLQFLPVINIGDTMKPVCYWDIILHTWQCSLLVWSSSVFAVNVLYFFHWAFYEAISYMVKYVVYVFIVYRKGKILETKKTFDLPFSCGNSRIWFIRKEKWEKCPNDNLKEEE